MDLSYIIESQICFAAMWVAYHIFLQDSGMFGQNRFYLLSSLVVSLFLPLFSIPIYPGKSYTVFPTPETAAGDFNYTIQTAAANTFNFNNILIAVYIIGVAVMLVLITLQLLKLRKLCKGSMVAVINKSRIIYTDKPDIAFSFFNYIFISKNLGDGDMSPVIAHEMCHVRLLHSADVVLAQIVLILFWWNPFVWLWQRSLREIHEYQADSKVLELGFDSKHYINLIISNLTDKHPEFVSGFSYSLIKKRLIMISKNKHGIFAKFRILLAIPVITALLAVFSFTRQPDVYKEAEKPAIDIEKQGIDSTRSSEKPDIRVIGVSTRKGALASPIVIVHRTDSTKKELTVQPLIVINGVMVNEDSDKNLTFDDHLKAFNFTYNDIESISVFKDQSAIELWGSAGANGVISITTKSLDKKPVIVINGVAVTPEPNKEIDDYLKDLNYTKDDIESITVLKDKKSTEVWGEQGANGVISIKTKK